LSGNDDQDQDYDRTWLRSMKSYLLLLPPCFQVAEAITINFIPN
jgi:hypothetical protein